MTPNLMTGLKNSWAAGFWEGEGSCGFYNVKRTRGSTIYRSNRLYVSASQVDPKPLYRLQKLFKGSVSSSMNNSKNLYGWKPRRIYRWCVANNYARLFLGQIKKYVVSTVKRKQLITALAKDRKWIRGRWRKN